MEIKQCFADDSSVKFFTYEGTGRRQSMDSRLCAYKGGDHGPLNIIRSIEEQSDLRKLLSCTRQYSAQIF